MLVILSAYATSSLVHSIAYMIDPIVEAYGILLMLSLSSFVKGHYSLVRSTPKAKGMNPFFELLILKCFSTLSMYFD